MKFVLFKDVLEERSAPQYGIVGDGEKPDVTCLLRRNGRIRGLRGYQDNSLD